MPFNLRQCIHASPKATLALSAVLIGMHVGLDGLARPLIFDRAAIVDGEYWRLFTAHLTHANATHLMWNLGTLLLMGGALESLYRLSFWSYISLMIMAGVGVTAYIWFVQTDLLYFVGISAVLNAQFIVLVFFVWRETRNPLALIVAAAGVLKIVAELILETPILKTVEGKTMPEAHGVGLIMGCLWIFIFVWMNKSNPTFD